jgi:hypothetical protein
MRGDIRKVEKMRTIQNGNNPGDAVDEYRHPSAINSGRKNQAVCINLRSFTDNSIVICKIRSLIYMKATGIVRRIDD